ncbi:hypothetical protein VL15_07475 [Burkholderia cepacia]|uniref:Uncharacterized protein n=1 Tax=Burkholderia cepacia TaxID=292 RepID=A0A0J5XAK0_BURCE|nr:SAV_2336 N-terminal domain-related protein [Burkholderia cepacia]KML60938.1 hypothetical protein VL15_07475 [Burkholderia cepacia]
MHEALIHCLATAGLTSGADEVLDIVWLAARIDAANEAKRPAREAEGEDEMRAEAAEVSPPVTDESTAIRPQPAAALASSPVPQVHRESLYADTVTGTLRGDTLLVPGVARIAATEHYRRALTPFARRVPSWRNGILDEEATATHAADSGVWLPIMRPRRERQFDVALVIEDCTSAEIRRQALGELATILRQDSGLRHVDVYRLSGDVHLRLTNIGNGRDYGMQTLAGDNHGRLVIFATDGTSKRWRNGSVQRFIHGLGQRTSVSMLHMLPRAAWRHTHIGAPSLMLYSSAPAGPNTRMGYEAPWWLDDSEDEGLVIPLLELDPASIGAWARGISSQGGAMPGVYISIPKTEMTEPAPDTAPTPGERVALYRSIVSTAAYDMAVFLSRIDPVTLPIMRLVQRTMQPDTDEGVLAEVLVGGLLQRQTIDDGGQERHYRFFAGVAEALFKELRYSEEDRIKEQLRRVGDALAESARRESAHLATFESPAGNARLSEWALPFADVSRTVLENWRAPEVSVEASTRPPEEPQVFVGREQELGHLRAWRAVAQTESATPLMITGPAGIGKTSLLDYFLSHGLPTQHQAADYVRVNATPGTPLLDTLATHWPDRPQEGNSADWLFDRLRQSRRLVVIDDIDTEAAYEECVALNRQAYDFPMLLAGRYAVGDSTRRENWTVMKLDGLNVETSTTLLRRLSDSAMPQYELIGAIAKALFGLPQALYIAAKILNNSLLQDNLSYWLGLDRQTFKASASLPEAENCFDDLVRRCTPYYHDLCLRWPFKLGRNVKPLQRLALLAHGPMDGATDNLANAIIALPRNTSTRSDDVPDAANIWEAAHALNLVQQRETLRLVPLYAACLRAQYPELAAPAMEQWTAWILKRVEGGESDWPELDSARTALEEWLERSPPDAGNRIGDGFIAYAMEVGPMTAWRSFCHRMASVHKGLLRAKWHLHAATLAQHDNHQAIAMMELHKAAEIADQSSEPGAAEILAKVEALRRTLRGTTPHPPPVTANIQLRDYQHWLSRMAVQATENANLNGGRIGLVLQPIGTGVTNTLIDYVIECRRLKQTVNLPYIIVANSTSIAADISDSFLRSKAVELSGQPLTSTVNSGDELDYLLSKKRRHIIVTTAHCLRKLRDAEDRACLIIGLNLHHQSLTNLKLFKRAIRIQFGDERLLLGRSAIGAFGPLIAQYSRNQAVEAGYLVAPRIRRDRVLLGHKIDKHRLFEDVKIFQEIYKKIFDERLRSGRQPGKVIFITKDIATATLAMNFLREIPEPTLTPIMLGAGQFRDKQLQKFSNVPNASLLVTSAQVASLSLINIDTCYLLSKLSPSALLRVESFVNRPRNNNIAGEIVDFARNDLRIIESAKWRGNQLGENARPS